MTANRAQERTTPHKETFHAYGAPSPSVSLEKMRRLEPQSVLRNPVLAEYSHLFVFRAITQSC